MRAGKTWALAALLLAAVCVVVVVAECPNGCSGNGNCMEKDKCDCYKNYQGNDCADRTCLFGRAHVDTPKGDINMDKLRKTPGWILGGSQQDPAQTYEYFNPDAIADEAHFYMECSNKGICDRSTGLCQCFDGYEGNGCQRTTCPGKCNDHGTCESIRELAAKNGGTLFGREGNVGAVKYDLWDANSTYGCRCDPWFHGPDCGKRNCKVGVDPLYMSTGKPRLETFVVHAYTDDAAKLESSWIRLRVFDHYGEAFITKKIPVLDDADATDAEANAAANAKAVADAITGVPNLTFGKITCEPMGATGDSYMLKTFLSLREPTGGTATMFGMAVTCQYIDNPGRMRLPEIASSSSTFIDLTNTPKKSNAFVVTTSMQGEDVDWFTTKTPFEVKDITSGGTLVTLTATSLTAAQLTQLGALAENLIKIGSHIVRVATAEGPGATAPFTLTLEHALNHPIGSSPAIFTADTVTWVGAATADAVAQTAPLAVGADKMKFDTTAPAIATGDLLFFENAFFYAQEITKESGNFFVRLDKKFGGTAAAGADGGATAKVFKVKLDDALKGYQYVSECSGRGMCGYDTGICTCFKGYTNDNCNRQNILAL